MTKCLVGVGNKHVQDLSFKSDPLQYLFIYVGSPILGRVTTRARGATVQALESLPPPYPP